MNLNACSTTEIRQAIPLHYRAVLCENRLLEAKKIAQVDLRVDVVGDLALVEESIEVGLHFGTTVDTQTEGKEAPQVFLHGRQLVAVQTFLPRLLGPPVLLQEEKSVTAQLTSSGSVISV